MVGNVIQVLEVVQDQLVARLRSPHDRTVIPLVEREIGDSTCSSREPPAVGVTAYFPHRQAGMFGMVGDGPGDPGHAGSPALIVRRPLCKNQRPRGTCRARDHVRPGELERVTKRVPVCSGSQPARDQLRGRIVKTLPELNKTLAGLRGAVAVAERALKDTDQSLLNGNSSAQQELRAALIEVTRAARSLRLLTDYLERNPEALLRGKGNR